MLTTKRKPATVGEILVEEFMQPMGLTQGVLAEAMGVQRKHVNELCNGRRNVTAPTALILARVFGNSRSARDPSPAPRRRDSAAYPASRSRRRNLLGRGWPPSGSALRNVRALAPAAGWGHSHAGVIVERAMLEHRVAHAPMRAAHELVAQDSDL